MAMGMRPLRLRDRSQTAQGTHHYWKEDLSLLIYSATTWWQHTEFMQEGELRPASFCNSFTPHWTTPGKEQMCAEMRHMAESWEIYTDECVGVGVEGWGCQEFPASLKSPRQGSGFYNKPIAL